VDNRISSHKIISLIVIITFLGVFAMSLMPGCGCPIPIMGSGDYQPVSDWEQSEFDKADFSVYPDDVRENIANYQDTTLAWAGIIVESELIEYDTYFEATYLLEHHYYDWIEDISPSPEWVWLSPRGEGFFRASCKLKKEANLSEIQEYSEPGVLLIVYGKAISIEDDIIEVDASYLRSILEKYYTTEKIDYGRQD
jgi:hypothetical protein